MDIILLTTSVGIFVFFIAVIIFAFASKNEIKVNNRIKELSGEKTDKAPLRQKQSKKKSKLTVSKAFAEELSTSGIRMRPEEFLILWLFVSFLPAVIMILLGVHPITIVATVAIGLVMPPIIVRRRKNKQVVIFEKQLGDALMLIGNCLRSGLTFQQAMGSIAKEMNDPIGREFARAVKEIQLGTNLDTALTNMQRRVKSTDLLLTISAVQIQHQVGGNLMEILSNISGTITERQKLKDDIKVMTATGRMSGIVVGMLPIGIGGILMLINPEYIQTFFNTSLGTIMLIVSGVMEIIGFLLIKKVITIKY
jgi:tight adherence protein B